MQTIKLEKKTRYRKGWTQEETTMLFDMAKAGLTVDQIAEAFSHRSKVGVRRKMEKLGFSVGKGGE